MSQSSGTNHTLRKKRDGQKRRNDITRPVLALPSEGHTNTMPDLASARRAPIGQLWRSARRHRNARHDPFGVRREEHRVVPVGGVDESQHADGVHQREPLDGEIESACVEPDSSDVLCTTPIDRCKMRSRLRLRVVEREAGTSAQGVECRTRFGRPIVLQEFDEASIVEARHARMMPDRTPRRKSRAAVMDASASGMSRRGCTAVVTPRREEPFDDGHDADGHEREAHSHREPPRQGSPPMTEIPEA